MELTEQGRDAQERFEQVWDGLETRTSDELLPADKHQLAELLDRIADNLDATDTIGPLDG